MALCQHQLSWLSCCDSSDVAYSTFHSALGTCLGFAQSSFLNVPLKRQLSFDSPVLTAGWRLSQSVKQLPNQDTEDFDRCFHFPRDPLRPLDYRKKMHWHSAFKNDL